MKNILKKLMVILLLVILIIPWLQDDNDVVYAESYSSSYFTDAKAFYDNIIYKEDENLVYNDNDGYFYFGYQAGKATTQSLGYNEIGHIITVSLSGSSNTYSVAVAVGQSEQEVGETIYDDTYAYRLFKVSYTKIQELLEKRYSGQNFGELYVTGETITVEIDTIMTVWDKDTGSRKDRGSIKENGAGWFTVSGTDVAWDEETWHNTYPYINSTYWIEDGFFNLVVEVKPKTSLIKSSAQLSGVVDFQKFTGDMATGRYTYTMYKVVKPNTPFTMNVTGSTEFATNAYQANSNFMGVTDQNNNILQLAQLATVNGASASKSFLRWNVGNNYVNYMKLNSYSQSRSSDLKTLTGTFNLQTSVHGQILKLYYCSGVLKNGAVTDIGGWYDLSRLSSLSTGKNAQWSGYFSISAGTILTDGVAPAVTITSDNARYDEDEGIIYVGAGGGTVNVNIKEDLTIVQNYMIRDSSNGVPMKYYNASKGSYGIYTDMSGYGSAEYDVELNVTQGKNFVITANDVVGNIVNIPIKVVFDDVPPVVTPYYEGVEADLTRWYNSKIDVTYVHEDVFGISDGYGTMYNSTVKTSSSYIGEQDTIIITSNTTATTNFDEDVRNEMIDGINTANIWSCDMLGNSADYDFNLKIDTIKPIIANDPDDLYMVTKTFNFGAYDEVSGMQKLKLINLDTGAELKVIEHSVECEYQTIDNLFSFNYTFAEAGNYQLIAYDFAGNENTYDFTVYANAKVKIIDVNIYDYESEADAMGVRYNYLPTGWCTEELYKYSLEDGYWNNWINEYKSIYDRYEYVCSTYITVSADEEDNVIYRFFVPTITVEAEYVSPNPKIMKYEIGMLNISHYGYVKELYIVLPKEYQNTSWDCQDGSNISFPITFNVPTELSLNSVQRLTTLPLTTQTVALEGEDSTNLFIPTDNFEDNTLKMTIIAYRGQPCETYLNAINITQANCDVMVKTVNISKLLVQSTDLSKLKWTIGSYGGWEVVK